MPVLVKRFLRGCWLVLALLVIFAAALLSAARLLLPVASDYREQVAQRVSAALGLPVQVEHLDAAWHGWGPSIELEGVTVLEPTGERALLRFEAARVDIDLLATLIHRQFEPGRLTMRGVTVSLVRHADGRVGLEGISGTNGADQSTTALRQWLQRQRRLALEEATLLWRDMQNAGETLLFRNVRLQLHNLDDRHQADGYVTLPEQLGSELAFALDVRGDIFEPAHWRGQLYARGAAVELARWTAGRTWNKLATTHGGADFEVWGEWSDGGLQRVAGTVDVRELQVAADSGEGSRDYAIDLLQGRGVWRRHINGWSLDAEQFSVTRAGRSWPLSNWGMRLTREASASQNYQIQFGYDYLRLDDVAEVLTQSGMLPEQWRKPWKAAQPTGVLRDGYVRVLRLADAAPAWLLHSAFEDVTAQAQGRVPGAAGLAGLFTVDNLRGVLDLEAEQLSLDAAHLFRAALPLDRVDASLAWRRGAAGDWRLMSKDLTLRNADIKLSADLRLDLPAEGGAPYVDVSAAFSDGNIQNTSRYLPAKVMPAGAVAWLDRALVAGRITQGSAQFRGKVSDFPFDRGEGRFEVRFQAVDGVLNYAPGWPSLTRLTTDAVFLNRGMNIDITSGKIYSTQLEQARVMIADITAKPALVTIQGRARGGAADAVRYVTESPLKNKFGRYLAGMEASGTVLLDLDVRLPLGARAQVTGDLRLENARLRLQEADLDMNRVQGTLSFTQAGLSANDIHAQLFDQPTLVDIHTETRDGARVTLFEARGVADAAVVAQRYAGFIAPYVAGPSAWRGTLLVGDGPDGNRLSIEAPLGGVELKLPAPLAKPAQEARNLVVELVLPITPAEPLDLRYGDDVAVTLALKRGPRGLAVERGEVRFGGEPALLPEAPGLRVAGVMAHFDEPAWAPILWPRGGDKESAPGEVSAPLVRQVTLTLDELLLLGRVFPAVQLSAQRGPQAWKAEVNSPLAVGHVTLPHQSTQPLTLNMERLVLARNDTPAADGEAETASLQAELDPRELPPLEITSTSFRYADLELGRLNLKAVRQTGGLRVETLTTESASHRLQIDGAWLRGPEGVTSDFEVSLHSEDFGGMLAGLGYSDVIQEGKGEASMRARWAGGPADFSLGRSTGTLNFTVKDGRLLEVEPGAGRFLGLVSFQALPRRLALDFSDFFQKGFGFDRLGGEFILEAGNAYTDNLHMEGPAARIEAKGRVGLLVEDYDQRVTVVPNVTAGLPLAGVLAGGVGVGAAVFVVEKLLKPGVDEMTRAEYHVTGSWHAPQIERLGKGGGK